MNVQWTSFAAATHHNPRGAAWNRKKRGGQIPEHPWLPHTLGGSGCLLTPPVNFDASVAEWNIPHLVCQSFDLLLKPIHSALSGRPNLLQHAANVSQILSLHLTLLAHACLPVAQVRLRGVIHHARTLVHPLQKRKAQKGERVRTTSSRNLEVIVAILSD